MTRINVVPVEELTDKHLLAEYRELPRVFALARKWYERGGDTSTLPKDYRMGEGHVKFFYDALWFCYERQASLYKECKNRGFQVQHQPDGSLIDWAPVAMLGGYEPTQEAIDINRARIYERLQKMEGKK